MLKLIARENPVTTGRNNNQRLYLMQQNKLYRVSTAPGTPGNLLEFFCLLEILEISWNFFFLLELFQHDIIVFANSTKITLNTVL